MEENEDRGIVLDESASKTFEHGEKVPLYRSVLLGIAGGLFGLIKWIVGIVIDVLRTLLSIVVSIGKMFYKAGLFVYGLFKDLWHKFKYNDWSGRLSFLLFGASGYAHGQIFNGIILTVFEVAYIVLFFLFGASAIGGLGSLGTNETHQGEVCTEDFCTIDTIYGDNSILVLIFGLLWVLSLLLFFLAWRSSINGGYRNYRIANFMKYRNLIREAEPSAKEIDEDITKNRITGHSFRELKDRYAAVYANLEAKMQPEGGPDAKFALDYSFYLLDGVIRYNREHQETLVRSAKKLAAIDDKIDRYDHGEGYTSKLGKAEGEYAEAQKELDKASERYWSLFDKKEREGLSEEEERAFNGEAKNRRALKNKVLSKGDWLVDFKAYHVKRLDKMQARRRILAAKADEEENHYLNFCAKAAVENDSKYGSSNKFYLRTDEFKLKASFYGSYKEIGEAYDEGYASYEKANADNLSEQAAIKNEFDAKIAKIRANYAEVRANRDKAIAEARLKYSDSPQTIKAVIASLPTEKQIRGMEKEEVDNATHSWKRDTKALKTNYTAESYADYSATSYMMLHCSIPFEKAAPLLKEVKARLTPEEASAHLAETKQAHEDYASKHLDNFDGRPKNLKEQVGSLLDENFHVTLLILPLLGVAFFTIMPLLFSILIAFTNYDFNHYPPGKLFTWIGLDNFASLFNPQPGDVFYGLANDLVGTVLWTLIWAVIATFSNYYLGILYALMINKEGVKFKKFWRTVFVLSIAMPQFISLIALSIILSKGGPMDTLWQAVFGHKFYFLDNDPTLTSSNILLTASYTKLIIILVNIWIGVPYTILQTSGILMNIPKDLYESSEIDGAGKGRQFFSITMPYIRFVLGPSLITTFIGNINNFGVIYFLTGGGPLVRNNALNLGHTDLLITFLYKLVTSSDKARFGIASTIGIVVFALCAFFSIIVYNKSDAVTKEDQFQ